MISRSHVLCAVVAFAILLIATPLFAVDLTVGWDPSSDPSVIGYRLYSGTTSGVYTRSFDAGLNTSMTVSALVGGTTYYFVVTAYNSSQIESAPSNEISYSVSAIDFNRDGKTDFLLLNPRTRQTGVWFLNNATYLGAAPGPALPASWALAVLRPGG